MITIVIAAGSGTRWDNFRGLPKHLVEIEGERLIDRTVRQFLKHGPVVVAGNDDRYRVDGAEFFIPERNPEWMEAAKFLDSQHYWATDGRTVVAYGDVWFSDECVTTIAEYDVKDWVLFARYGLSEMTGGGSECFAQSFWPEQIDEHRQALLYIADLRWNKGLVRCGGWEHYRQMNGVPLNQHVLNGRFFNINDWTDDFDYPDDLVEWEKRRAER